MIFIKILVYLLILSSAAFGLSVTIPGPGTSVTQISNLVNIDQAQSLPAATTVNMFLPTDVPVGAVVIVGCVADGTFNTISVADNSGNGNTYTTSVQFPNGPAIITSNKLTTKLNSGTTITITSGTAILSGWCTSVYITGLSSSVVDKSAFTSIPGNGSSSVGILSQANEIFIGLAYAKASGGHPGTLAAGGGFGAASFASNFGTATAFSAQLAYKIIFSTTPPTYSWTGTGVTTGITAAATFKGN